MSTIPQVSVSARICTTGAHLSCCMLGVLGVRVVVTVIDDDGSGNRHCHRHRR